MNISFLNESQSLLLYWIDAIIFFIFLSTVLYLFFFTIFPLFVKKRKYPIAEKENKLIIIYVWVGDIEMLKASLESLFKQTYSREMYDIYVISTEFTEEETELLQQLPVKIETMPHSNSEIEILNDLINRIEEQGLSYDALMLLSSNDSLSEEGLVEINNALYAGCYFVQTHYVIECKESSGKLIQAISTEINNSVFRKGHTLLNLSSALFNFGVVYDFKVLKKCLRGKESLGLEKELEKILLENNYYIEYLDDVFTFNNEKKPAKTVFQKRMKLQKISFISKMEAIKALPIALLKGNIDYSNKLFQWILPSRVMLLLATVVMASIVTYIDLFLAIKWWILFVTLIITFGIALPSNLTTGNLLFRILTLPFVLPYERIKRIFSKK